MRCVFCNGVNGVNYLNSGAVVLGAASAGFCDTCTIVFGNACDHVGLCCLSV